MNRLTDPSTENINEIVASYSTDLDHGLSVQAAARRLEQDGPNELRVTPPVSAWRRFLTQFRDPVIYLLLIAMTIALAAWVVEGQDGWPLDAIVIVSILVFNAVLGYLQEAKAQNAVAALSRMTTANSTVCRDGRMLRVPSAQLVLGDLLVLAEGDAVGADARLVQIAALHLSEASLTGESVAVSKEVTVLEQSVPVADRRNMVFKGTTVTQGSGTAIIVATGMNTEVGSIATMLDATQEDPTPLQKEVAKIGRMLTVAVVIIALVVVTAVLLGSDIQSGTEVVSVLLLGISLAVAAVPEGLPAILSVVLALGVRRMAKRDAIVKKLSSVETLGSTSVICSDKTGTLTRSEMTIERIVTASGTSYFTGVGYAPIGEVQFEGEVLRSGAVHTESIALLSGACVASNAQLEQNEEGVWEIQGDATEAAFFVAERKLGGHERRKKRFERIAQIPFSSERKIMSTVAQDHERNNEVVIITKGAPDFLLDRCNRLRVGSNVVELTEQHRLQILGDVDSLSDAALRTLAVAYRPLESDEDPHSTDNLERDLIFIGTAGMIDPPREGVAQSIRDAQFAGIRVIMITGDHPRTGTRIALDLGIAQPGASAITGAQIESLDDAELIYVIRNSSVFARVAPAHKLRIVDALQADGHIVAMTGDGVNDAPALKSSNIGIAMGITGTDVSKEAAAMILASDNFATIVEAVREGRAIFDNIRKFLRYLLSSNMGEVLTVFLGVVGASVIGLTNGVVVLPLLATQILWINLITDSAPALAMGVDPETDDLMSRPPRRLTDRIIDAGMWRWVIQVGLVMAMASLLTIDLYLPGGLIEGEQSLANARTAGFTVLVLAQLFNCFNTRSDRISAFHQLFVNQWLWSAVVLSVLLQIAVVNIGFLNLAFNTVPLSLEQWMVCFAMGSSVLWYGELNKLLRHRITKRAPTNRASQISS